MLELLVVGSTLTALVLAGSVYRRPDRGASSTAVVDLTTAAPTDVSNDGWAAPDLPCPWCGAYTREDDEACPACGQRFG